MLLGEIAAYLTGLGLAATGTDLYQDYLPDQPDALVALYGYAGRPPDLTHDEADYVAHPGLQVMVRGANTDSGHDDARARLEAIKGALLRLRNADLSGTRYQRVVPLQEPFFLMRDDSFRPLFACNFTVSKDQ